MVHTSIFWYKFGSLSPAVTLKIRSKSPKPNQLVIMSQCYIHANLVKIHPPVHAISCKQESVMPTPLQQDPHQKRPPPLRWGDILNIASMSMNGYLLRKVRLRWWWTQGRICRRRFSSSTSPRGILLTGRRKTSCRAAWRYTGPGKLETML